MGASGASCGASSVSRERLVCAGTAGCSEQGSPLGAGRLRRQIQRGQVGRQTRVAARPPPSRKAEELPRRPAEA